MISCPAGRYTETFWWKLPVTMLCDARRSRRPLSFSVVHGRAPLQVITRRRKESSKAALCCRLGIALRGAYGGRWIDHLHPGREWDLKLDNRGLVSARTNFATVRRSVLTYLHCSSSLCLCRNRATLPLRAFVLNTSPMEPALSNSVL
jgi:hypothetical protein